MPVQLLMLIERHRFAQEDPEISKLPVPLRDEMYKKSSVSIIQIFLK